MFVKRSPGTYSAAWDMLQKTEHVSNQIYATLEWQGS